MKKKLHQKLSLSKETIVGLNPDEMKKIKGASILHVCSDSCSVFFICCDTLTRGCPEEEKIPLRYK